MSLVVDATVAVSWLFNLAGSARLRTILEEEEELIAPDLITAEVANAAWRLVLFDGVDPGFAARAVREVARFFDEIVPCTELKDRAFAIALDLRHPVYDCFYLALCERRGGQIATLDERLLRRCRETPYAKLFKRIE